MPDSYETLLHAGELWTASLCSYFSVYTIQTAVSRQVSASSSITIRSAQVFSDLEIGRLVELEAGADCGLDCRLAAETGERSSEEHFVRSSFGPERFLTPFTLLNNTHVDTIILASTGRVSGM